jgi:pimeloyl-ACP methyl ester carboxylesterase
MSHRADALLLLVPFCPVAGQEHLLDAVSKGAKETVMNARDRPTFTWVQLQIIRIIQRIPHGKLLLKLGGFAEVDLAAVEKFPVHRTKLKQAALEGTKPGIQGTLRDLQCMATIPAPQDAAAQLQCPVLIWAGEQDKTTPVAMAQWYKNAMPHAELHVLPDQGHFVGFKYEKDILESIL